jgi:peptidoglycan/LPS O-acetylase OafA/YrhL
LHRGLRWPVLVWIGRISYGVYLWHFPLLTFVPPLVARVLPPGRRALYAAFLLQIGLSIGLAAISFYWIEQPFLRLKERFTCKRYAHA